MPRLKKRKFAGNQHVGPSKTASQPARPGFAAADTGKRAKSTSEVKVGRHLQHEFPESVPLSGFRFVELQRLIDFLDLFCCPECKENGTFSWSEKRFGLSSSFSVTCNACGHCLPFSTSGRIAHGPFEANTRFQLASYSSGRHYQQSQRFCAAMNLPPPVRFSPWTKSRTTLHRAIKAMAEQSMKVAADEVKRGVDTGATNVTVSCDATWQRRGFSSKNGIATTLSIDGQKVIDVEAKSNYCHQCCIFKKKLAENDFKAWKEAHRTSGKCMNNHEGSAGAMEPKAMVDIFRRSETTRGLRYTGYLGDGDSKSYKTVCDNHVYGPNQEIQKLECCGHIQKRMGKRLMDIISANKGKSFTSNGRRYTGIGGAGRLTTKAVKRIQGHYGAAIRGNVGDITGMHNAIWAILQHRQKNHELCGSWCPFSKKGADAANKNALPEFVTQAIRPAFVELSSDTLLKKCLHGGTQNSNESFHNVIWNRVPKEIFVSRQRLEIGLFDAVGSFNDGELHSKTAILSELKLQVGFWGRTIYDSLDNQRIKRSYLQPSAEERAKKRVKVDSSDYASASFH